MTRLRAWLELTRGANLPTVWSNLLVGWLLAVASGATPWMPMPFTRAPMVVAT